MQTCGVHFVLPVWLLEEQEACFRNTLFSVAVSMPFKSLRAISSQCVVSTDDCSSKPKEGECRKRKWKRVKC